MKSKTASKTSIVFSIISIIGLIIFSFDILSSIFGEGGFDNIGGLNLTVSLWLIIIIVPIFTLLALIFSIISLFLKKEKNSNDKNYSIVSLILGVIPILWYINKYLGLLIH